MPEREHAEAAQACSHRWMIESPNGPTSMGTCMICGAKGEFKNSIPISGWERASSRAKKNSNKNAASPSPSTGAKSS